jgi:uncharacterized phage infection (PIP) family protein YhgE
MNKVKITYAVDLDKVPHKSQELMTEAYYWLSGALVNLEQINLDSEKESFQKILEQIDKIRQALADVDQRLDDCTAVMSGYHKTMIDLSAPTQEQHQPSPEELSEHLRELQNQLSVPAGGDNE